MLNFLQKFGIFCFLDNHHYNFDASYECIAAAGIADFVSAGDGNGLAAIDIFKNKHEDWIFGHVCYDIKNEIETLASSHPDSILFPDFYFFVPEIVFIVTNHQLQIGILNADMNADEIFTSIISTRIDESKAAGAALELKARFTKKEYVETVEKLQQHILKGDCYEINFCQEFYLNKVIDPLVVYRQLSNLSPNPFSAFYRLHDKYLLCASPERFLKKSGKNIISQPMKGTAKRIVREADDELQKQKLRNDEKERSENIMIVDLVRNDLAKICEEGSVAVKEFLNIYSFPNVHQMISTVSGILKEDISMRKIFHATFPMGSMTGAPKRRVMELIEKYERTKRGLFSGTIGYITPGGDFDFNVVIRSILYNETKKYVSVQAGAAITWKSIAEKEYHECLVKIEAIKKSLG